MISVVIPYFQRQPGVLSRALRSVAQQRGCAMPIEVIVVDDASPVPAAPEVAAVAMPAGTTVRVLTQANGGPGAARNTALDAVAPQAVHVAFLDSDDEWHPDHLARAVIALDQGYDFYFSDLLQLDQTVGAFARAGRIRPADHPSLPGAENLHAFAGDMFDQILHGNVIGTPAVVLRARPCAQHRFRTDLARAGEDYLFWMEVAKAGATFAFSSQVEVTCGRGVNIFAGATWGTDAHFARLRDELSFRKTTLRAFALNAAQRQKIRHGLRQLRLDFATAWLHRLRTGNADALPVLLDHCRSDPASIAAIPKAAWRAVVKVP